MRKRIVFTKMHVTEGKEAHIGIEDYKKEITVQFSVDLEDVPKVFQYSWIIHDNKVSTELANGNIWPMSWVILGRPVNGYVYFHLNGKPDDNRKRNIKYVSESEFNELREIILRVASPCYSPCTVCESDHCEPNKLKS